MKITADKGLYELIANVVGACGNEGNINFTPKGICVMCADAGKSFAARLEIAKEACEEYNANNENVIIDVKNLNKNLSILNGTVTMELNERLVLTAGLHKFYTKVLGECLTKIDKMPQVNLSISFEISTNEFLSILKACALYSDYIRILTDGKKIIFLASDWSDNNKYTYAIDVKDLEFFECNNGSANTLYMVRFLTNIANVLKLFEKIKITFDNKLPLKINANNEHISIEFWLAPTIED